MPDAENGFHDSNSPNYVNPTPRIAAELEKNNHFALSGGGILHSYHNGVFLPDGEEAIERLVTDLVKGMSQVRWSTHLIHEVYHYIRIGKPVLPDIPGLDRINLQNGVLNIEKMRLEPHSPNLRSTIQLPVRFDPKADCPRWKSFVKEVLPEDTPDLIWEVAAWLMMPILTFQKALLLIGGRGTGKSTCLRGFRSFLGDFNTTAYSLHTLEDNRFASARLVGKLANICPDLPTSKISSMATFKAITGGDPIIGEYKGGRSFDFISPARLVFSANNFPESSDRSDASLQRWMFAPFNRRFPNRPKKTKELDDILASPNELSGLLNQALRVLPRVMEDGITITESMQAEFTEYRVTADPLGEWLSTNLVGDPNGLVPHRELLEIVQGTLGSTINNTELGLAMNRTFPNSRVVQRIVNGVLCRVRTGVRYLNSLKQQ